MTSPAKSRYRSLSGADPRMGTVVNDNTPPVFPAHELSGLDALPRPPAAEAVVHYGRLTGIASFPIHPDETADALRAAPPIDALPEPPMAARPPRKKAAVAASLCSLLCHAAVFAALTMAVVTLPDAPVEDAGDTVSVVMLGNGDADQQASGEESEEPPKPDQIVAEAVQPDVVEPARETPDATPPVETAPVQPAETTAEAVQPDAPPPVTQVSPDAVVSTEPEVLAAQVPAEPTVAQPQATEIQPEDIKPAAAKPAAPTAVQPEPVPPPPETVPPPPPEATVTPVEKPAPPPPPVQKPKEVVKKPPPKAAKVKSGSKGENEQDAKRGSSEGTDTAQSDRTSQAVGNRQGSGSAAVANYPGKVQARIRRSVRVPSAYRRMTDAMTVRVRLTVGSGGELSSLSLARSSGIPDLDNAVLEGVRRAAPFPSLPPEWGKPSWTFTQEVQVTGN